jgi:putative oxygen-independent coproporphyrinogen III oxidase
MIATPRGGARGEAEQGWGPGTDPGSRCGSVAGSTLTGMFGTYVHVPFCVHRCDYCAFATWTDRGHLMGSYARACVAEVERAALPPSTSVFFGGGTPSLLPAEMLGSILASIPRARRAEVTVECNPETVDAPLLAAYREAGVTRLSFGAQSMVPSVLASLGRRHDPSSVRRVAQLAGDAGFGASYSVDLIFGGAGETVAQWRRSLEEVLALDPAPSHVSAYGLTVEAGTPLAADPSRHPDPDDQADKYLLADQLLSAAGLEWYEISNWARPGAECRHNQLYWSQGEYRGIGASAHSHRVLADGSARRWWNVRTPERYLRLIEGGDDPAAADDLVDVATRRLEAGHLALRTRRGVPAASLQDDPLIEGLVYPEGDRLVLTVEGRLLANEVALRLIG